MLPDNQPEIIDAKTPPGRLDDTTEAPREAQRSRGGQPGNLNALRHGFYARDLGNFSPREYPEVELRNLLGEAAMIKDYMYFLYNHNLGSTNSAILAETLRALSLGGMALTRLLLIHNRIRVYVSPSTEKSLSDILDSLDSATTHANKRFPETDDDEDEEVDDDEDDEEED